MVEPISMIAAGVGITKAVVEAASFMRGLAGSDVTSAYFDWAGNRIAGSEDIEIEVQPDGDGRNEAVWWFSVKEREEYSFIRFPSLNRERTS